VNGSGGDVQPGDGVPKEGHDDTPQWSEGSEPSRSEGVSSSRDATRDAVVPDPEVPDKAKRRTFTAEYKLRVLGEVDEAGAGEIGSILRREGLYWSHLITWRRERKRRELDAVTPKKRGPRPKHSAAEVELERLRRENERLHAELEKAQLIIDVQKKLARLLGNPIPETPSEGGPSS
jgi:transposase